MGEGLRDTMSHQFSPDKAANLYSGPNLTQSAALGSIAEASALNSALEPERPPAAPSSYAGISVARRGSGDRSGGHNRTSSADMKTLEQIQAENAELKLTIDSLKFYDDPDKVSAREKAIIVHTFSAIAGPSAVLRVSELRLLNDRLGTNITDDDLPDLLASFEKTEDGTVTADEFLKWYMSPENLHIVRRRHRKKILHKGEQIAEEEFQLHKVMSHDINVPGTFEYRVAFSYKHQPISPWHDIPLFPHGAEADEVHFICEIPKYTRKKFEIATGEYLNRIKQDVAHGVLREYKHGDMCFNYGALPQTWEDPSHFSEETQAKGDNDPVDAIEMGLAPMKTGAVTKVRVLGVLALIDSGETDWKVICLRTDDFLADNVHTLDELECVLPGAVGALREWLREYKVCTGKGENSFGFEGSCMPKPFALKIIHETHNMWKGLVANEQLVV